VFCACLVFVCVAVAHFWHAGYGNHFDERLPVSRCDSPPIGFTGRTRESVLEEFCHFIGAVQGAENGGGDQVPRVGGEGWLALQLLYELGCDGHGHLEDFADWRHVQNSRV
jgi:hypothetical protein